MAKPFHTLLAESLTRVEKLAKEGIVRGYEISRRDRERLTKGGWLQLIISDWYLLVSPQSKQGESTAWYASFWVFIQQYLQDKFGDDYCLSADSSLDIHTANNVIPKQVIAITKSGGNYTLALPHHTSMVIYQDAKGFPTKTELKNKLQLMFLSTALCRVTKSFFKNQPMNAKIALLMLQDPSEITRPLLQGGMVPAAGRLVGAFRQVGREAFAQAILQTMEVAGFTVVEENPFEEDQKIFVPGRGQRIRSPYSARIVNMWETMREDVIKFFPKRKSTQASANTVIQHIEDVYVNDAYNSLSIEGYKVSKPLIEKIRNGSWRPEEDESDFQHKNAMAAKGYFLAFGAVKKSIRAVLRGSHAATIVEQDLSKWYQALFSPSVEAGLVESFHLAGYRNHPVYIRQSLHVPPPREAVLDCMEAFFECLKKEENPIARAVLGHFVFVFIHPYMDGNGRVGRFLMNVLWIAAGYPWTIVRLESRKEYLRSLEHASVNKDIKPFTTFLADEMAVKW